MTVQKMNIIISGRKYPVKVEEGEEEVIRTIEKNINRKINEFVKLYEYNDKLDVVTLILLNCSLDLYNLKHSGQDKKLINSISEIENLIDQIS